MIANPGCVRGQHRGFQDHHEFVMFALGAWRISRQMRPRMSPMDDGEEILVSARKFAKVPCFHTADGALIRTMSDWRWASQVFGHGPFWRRAARVVPSCLGPPAARYHIACFMCAWRVEDLPPNAPMHVYFDRVQLQRRWRSRAQRASPIWPGWGLRVRSTDLFSAGKDLTFCGSDDAKAAFWHLLICVWLMLLGFAVMSSISQTSIKRNLSCLWANIT